MSGEIRINLHQKGEKTDELICNWCGLPHPVEPEYKQKVLERGRREVGENQEAIEKAGIKITPEQTWTCGACFLYLSLPEDARFLFEGIATAHKVECDHEVPETREDKR